MTWHGMLGLYNVVCMHLVKYNYNTRKYGMAVVWCSSNNHVVTSSSHM